MTRRLRVLLIGLVLIDSPIPFQGPIIVPATVPRLVIRVDDLITDRALRVSIGKHQSSLSVVAVGRPFIRIGRIDIAVKEIGRLIRRRPSGLRIAQRNDHASGREARIGRSEADGWEFRRGDRPEESSGEPGEST